MSDENKFATVSNLPKHMDPDRRGGRPLYTKTLSRKLTQKDLNILEGLKSMAQMPEGSLRTSGSGSQSPKIFRGLRGELQPELLAEELPTPPAPKGSRLSGVPVFLGPDGTLYDIDYVPIQKDPPILAAVTQTNCQDGATENGHQNGKPTERMFTPSADVYYNFPEPEGFENFFDYEQAVLDWKENVNKKLGSLRLPTPLGRHLYRPKMVIDYSAERRDSSASTDSLSFETFDDGQRDIFVDQTPPQNSELLASMSRSNSDLGLEETPSTEDLASFQREILAIRMRQAEYQTGDSGSAQGSPRDGGYLPSPPMSAPDSPILSPILSAQLNEDKAKIEALASQRPIVFLNRKSRSFNYKENNRKSIRMSDSQTSLSDVTDEDGKWMYFKDPWEAQLYPTEPDPECYDTKEEYEHAMLRWAKICYTSMSFIPPHPHQLENIIHITPASKRGRAAADEEMDDGQKPSNEDVSSRVERITVKTVVRTGELDRQALMENFKTNFGHVMLPPPPPDYTYGSDPLVPKLKETSAKAVRKLTEVIEDLSLNIDPKELYRKFDILPIFAPAWKSFIQLHSKNLPSNIGSGPTSLSSSSASYSFKSLRRTDLYSELDMTPLQKDFPEQDVIIDLSRLSSSKATIQERSTYVQSSAKAVKKLDYVFRHDNINTKYWPKRQKLFEVTKQEVLEKVKASTTFNVSTARMLFTSGLMSDQFLTLLKEKVPEKTETFLESLMEAITEHDCSVFNLLEFTNDPRASANIGVFLHAVFEKEKSLSWVASIMQECLDHEDIDTLWNIAKARTFSEPAPIDIFPYKPNTFLPLIKMAFKNSKNVLSILLQTYMYYYLSVILQTPMHADIKEYLVEQRRDVGTQIAELLNADKDFLFLTLFVGIRHRSSSLSGLFLFIAVQLMSCYDCVNLQKQLRAADAGLVANIKSLAESKFQHTQFAAKRLFGVLQEEQWRDFFYNEYGRSKCFFEDLCSKPVSGSEGESLLSKLVLKMAVDTLARVPASKDQLKNYPVWLLSDTLFHQVLSHIIKAKVVDISVDQCAIFLEHLTRALFKLNLIDASDKIKSTRGKTSTTAQAEPVAISLADIGQISTFVQNKADKWVARTSMLEVLRHMFKHKGIFEFLKKEAVIFSRVVVFCKDGRNAEFNRSAWRLFYQVVHYHHAALELLLKGNLLAQFLDVMGPSAGNTVLINSLYYIYKIFAMTIREPNRVAQGKAPARGGGNDAVKTMEKDIKLLCKYFVSNHLFIKVHMIYKRLLTLPPGMAFLTLAALYHAIGTVPACKKLVKDLSRNTEYRDGLAKLLGMHNATGTLASFVPLLPSMNSAPNSPLLEPLSPKLNPKDHPF